MDAKPVSELTDDELFEELRDQVNMSRGKGHDRKRTRELGAEMKKRGWTGHRVVYGDAPTTHNET